MKKYSYIIVFFFFLSVVNAQEKAMNLSLDEAITYALKNNYNAKVAVNDIASAKKRKWETTTIGLPQINGKVDYQNWLKQQISLLPAEITGGAPGTFIPITFGTKQNLNASVTLSQLLFDGSYLVGLQASKTYLKISKLAKDKTASVIKEAVINAYGNILVSQKSIEILEKNKAVLVKNVNDAKQIYKNGFNEEEDIEQLQITLSIVNSQLNKIKRLRIIGYKMLNITLGNSIETKLIVTDNLDSLTAQHLNIGLVGQTFNVQNHIDFKIATNDREGKRLLMRLEQSKALPSLSAFVNYGTVANSDTFSFFRGNQKWYDSSLMGISLNIPIFSSLQRSAKIAQARITLESADVRLEEIKQKLHLAVAVAKSNYQFSIEQYQTAKENLALAERIEKKQQIKFFEGISTSFNLSQAQNQLYSQQQNYVQSMLEVIAKKAALENALNNPIK